MSTSKHPIGLRTLFFTEMWERMSYYGMRGILVLFMTASISNGGLDFNNASASAIYGIYAAAVYLMALPGGWVADNLFGQQKTILFGGIVIMFGHLSLAVPNMNFFYIGLILVVLGTGLLKPNISAIVGGLYENNPSMKESGFTIFLHVDKYWKYFRFFICGYLGENIGWHYGFGAAGIGMLLGVLQYRFNLKSLGDIGLKPTNIISQDKRNTYKKITLIISLLVLIFIFSGLTGLWSINPVPLANILTLIIASISLIYFLYIYYLGQLNENERKKL